MSEAHKALHMAVMKPRELRLVVHPSSFYVFIYLYIYIYFIFLLQRGALTRRGIKQHIKATSIVQGYKMINRAASSAVNSQRASVFVKAQVNVREDESY